MRRVKPWRERQVMGALVIAAVTGAVLAALPAWRDAAIWKLAALVMLLCIGAFAGRAQLVPLVRYDQDTLVVRNSARRYEIPWATLRGVNWDDRTGLSLTLEGDRTVEVQAFSRWPSFGRHRRVIDELERMRPRQAEPGAGDVTVTPAPPVVELIFFASTTVLIVALLVKGGTALFS
ncbi:hypothetical protein [Streptomyces akebiae]|uniref:PH domain-containing protein n=1 Tax=Streptomyces akebiae TaxID=2865673 RepID=A0ABX8XQI0_9ACTN|nr:hypothetical protein [Streptomyces akebiae]QYX78020.1 hypothetical protein K1J60_17065 [Streptomyces akebiae]